MRKLKKLEDIISVSVVHWFAGDQGWEFAEGLGCTPDSVNHVQYLYQVYTIADSAYTGRITVPVL